MIAPITPDEAINLQRNLIPDEVVKAFNTLIAQNMSGSRAKVPQAQVITMACEHMGISRDDFDCKWLNVEPMYEKIGWNVEYDSPGYSDSYNAYFTFSKP